MSDITTVPETKTPPKIDCVQLDGLVLLKIVKHCKENVPDLVTGQLLGLDCDSTLEVTHSFPLLPDSDESNEDSNYEVDMMNALSAVRVDTKNVGWYQCTFLSDFYNVDIVQCHLSYQREIPNAVVILFDPFKTQKGQLVIKALRLTDNFMKLAAKEDFSAKAFKEENVDYQHVFEEIPITVHNSSLAHAYLYELMESNTMDCTYDRLDISNTTLITKLIDGLTTVGGAFDELTTELDRNKVAVHYATKQRSEIQKRLDALAEENETRKAANLPVLPIPDELDISKIPEPSKLDSTIITAKINAYCNDLQSISMDTYKRQCVYKGLMKGAGVETTPVDVETTVMEE